MSQGANGNGYQPQAAYPAPVYAYPSQDAYGQGYQQTNYYEAMPYPNLAPNDSNPAGNTVANVQQQQSSALSSMASQTCYDNHKKEPALPFILNFILGFGIGSFVEGDNLGGWIMLGTQLGGFVRSHMLTGITRSAKGYCHGKIRAGFAGCFSVF